MKVLHSAMMANPEPGIVNQMTYEQEAARDLGLDWTSRVFCRADAEINGEVVIRDISSRIRIRPDIARRLVAWSRLRSNYYQWLEQQLSDYDVLLLRYGTSSPQQRRFVSRAKVPVYFVHHTLEGHELRLGTGLLQQLRFFLEALHGPPSIRAVSGLIGVTPEILAYERERACNGTIPGTVYPNGILYAPSWVESPKREGAVPELLFLASQFVAWHGLDMLLDSVERSTLPFVLHLVGRLGDADRERVSSDPRIRFHGLLGVSELSALSNRCWVGISSFALHRKHMEQACTLKVREYLMNGLPVYAGYSDVFPVEFPFYRRGEADISSIIAYANEVASTSREEVSRASQPYISKHAVLGALHNWLQARHAVPE